MSLPSWLPPPPQGFSPWSSEWEGGYLISRRSLCDDDEAHRESIVLDASPDGQLPVVVYVLVGTPSADVRTEMRAHDSAGISSFVAAALRFGRLIYPWPGPGVTSSTSPLESSMSLPTAYGRKVLQQLATGGSVPRQEFNAGGVTRLLDDGHVRIVTLPSPYADGKKRRDAWIEHLQITTLGREALGAPLPTRPADPQARVIRARTLFDGTRRGRSGLGNASKVVARARARLPDLLKQMEANYYTPGSLSFSEFCLAYPDHPLLVAAIVELR